MQYFSLFPIFRRKVSSVKSNWLVLEGLVCLQRWLSIVIFRLRPSFFFPFHLHFFSSLPSTTNHSLYTTLYIWFPSNNLNPSRPFHHITMDENGGEVSPTLVWPPEGMLQCPKGDCPRLFTSRGSMEAHQAAYEDHAFCKSCNVQFMTHEELFLHQLVSKRHHNCPICNRSFNSDAGRDLHIQTVSFETNFARSRPNIWSTYPGIAPHELELTIILGSSGRSRSRMSRLSEDFLVLSRLSGPYHPKRVQ